MRQLCKIVLVLGIVALVTSPALTQQQQRRGQFGGGGVAGLLVNKGVQQELKISEEQGTKVSDALKKVREDNKDLADKLRDQNLSREERAEATKKLGDASMAAIKDILKPEQIKRLQQIQRQQAGLLAFRDEEVVKALNLNDEQKDKIRTLSEDVRKDSEDLRKDAPRGDFAKLGEVMKKIAGLQKEATEKVVGLLNADQKKAWKELTGEPFEVRFEFRRPNQNN